MHYIGIKDYINSRNIRSTVVVFLAISLLWGTASCLTPSEKHLKNAAEALLQEDNEKAIDEFTKVLEMDPDNASIYYARGSCYYRTEQYDLAISDANMAIEYGHKHLDREYELRGLSYSTKGDYDTAVSDFTKAIEINKNPSYYNSRGLAYEAKKDYDMAIEDFSTAIQIEPLYPIYYSNRADVYIAMGQKSLAIADLKKTLEFAQDDDSELIQISQDRLESLGVVEYEINK